MKNLLLSTAIAIAAFTFSTYAQQSAGTTEPVLTKLPRAVSPKDGYPGDVNVRVTVNEQGEVTDAEFVSGPGAVCEAISRPDVLKTRDAAVERARQAKFTPATNGGQPVESSTIMSVQFAVPKSKPQKASTAETLMVFGDRNYSAVQAPEKPITDPKPDTSNSSAATKALPVRDENVYLASNVPPTTGTGSYKGKTISGGVLNGRATSLPKPKYPAAARAVRASGAVQVQVLIDENGNVFLAQAVGGHPLLQGASVAAACSSTFSPTLLAGQPVKVSGIITYNFVP